MLEYHSLDLYLFSNLINFIQNNLFIFNILIMTIKRYLREFLKIVIQNEVCYVHIIKIIQKYQRKVRDK